MCTRTPRMQPRVHPVEASEVMATAFAFLFLFEVSSIVSSVAHALCTSRRFLVCSRSRGVGAADGQMPRSNTLQTILLPIDAHPDKNGWLTTATETNTLH